MSSFFEKLAKLTIKSLIKKSLNKALHDKKTKKKKTTKRNSPQEKSSTAIQDNTKNHPWRLCPTGEHWVIGHERKLKTGTVVDRTGHCRQNPKRKTEFYTAEELRTIAQTHFESLSNNLDIMPIADALGFPNGNKYDPLIAGWTKFWNEILLPEDPLTADFIKALIATESSFNLPQDQTSSDGPARGLIQVTESTRKILQNHQGELRNHHIELTVDESREPVTNIAAGVRWLHHKKFLLEHRLKRKVTWEEAGAEYKGIFGQIGKNKVTDRIMSDLRKYHQRLIDQRKKK
jgi:hypothetical protein